MVGSWGFLVGLVRRRPRAVGALARARREEPRTKERLAELVFYHARTHVRINGVPWGTGFGIGLLISAEGRR